MTIPVWSERVSPALNSQGLALMIYLPMLILFNGSSIFSTLQIAHTVSFFDNIWIIYLIFHSIIMLVLIIRMSINTWSWKLQHFGIVILVFATCLFNLFFGAYISIAIYSNASIAIKFLMIFLLVAYASLFAFKSVIKPLKITLNINKLNDKIFVENKDHFIFYQLNELNIKEKNGFKLVCNTFIIILFLLFAFISFFFKSNLVVYFDVDWRLIAYTIFAFPFVSLVVSTMISGISYLYISQKIFKLTGKYVYLNDMKKNI